MEKFKKGDRISLTRDIDKKGEIDVCLGKQGGYIYYSTLMDDGTNRTFKEEDIRYEVKSETVWDLLVNNSLADYRNFTISSTIHKVRNSTANTISTLKASRTIFKPYQFKPLVKFLNSDIKRLLIADEVGLGKTIEAGHILLEMAARGALSNALIICTNSLKDKWKTELANKFNFHFKVYEETKHFIQDLKDDISQSKRSLFGIINYEKCRSSKIIDVLESSDYKFDFIICDEAHKIRNSFTAQHKGVKDLIERSEAVVFLTATPIMTDISNLHNLLKVLDEEAFEEFDVFNNAISLNRPFIRALSQLNARQDLVQIASELQSTEVHLAYNADDETFDEETIIMSKYFADDKLYQRAISNLYTNDISAENRVRIQQDLTDLNSLNHLYTRTRKRDVMSGEDLVTRIPRTITVELSESEQDAYDEVCNRYGDGNSLGLIQQKRQISSCIPAFKMKRENLEKGVYSIPDSDEKYRAFQHIINEVVISRKRKIIVFAFFTNTLLYLKCRLEDQGINTQIIYGGIKDRTERIEDFRDNDSVHVLLSSEVGSEGLDLQFCDALINYDLPWNPMVVEQRIGRIDRVGQESETINIYNLILSGTIEERIYQRLFERINLFKESLGDLESILGENEALGDLISKGIEELYTKNISEEEQNRKIDQMCLAVENERQTLRRIQNDLTDTFSNDFHFNDEINNIQRNKRYITEDELIKLIESIIRIELSYLRPIYKNDRLAGFEIPANARKKFFDFLENYKDNPRKSPELDALYKQFKTKYSNNSNIEFTFNQKDAYKNSTKEFITSFHPLVNAITNYFFDHNFHKNQAHKLSIELRTVDELILEPGFYFLSSVEILVSRTFGSKKKNDVKILKNILADINGDEVRILDETKADLLTSILLDKGRIFETELNLNEEFVSAIKPAIMIKMSQIEEEICEDEKIKFESSIQRRTDQELAYLNRWLERRERQLAEGNVPVGPWKKYIQDLEDRIEQATNNLKASNLETTHSLVSTNLIEVL